MKAIRKLADDESATYPPAATLVPKTTYLDVVCYSVPELSDAFQLKDESILEFESMFTAGDFYSQELLNSLPETHRHKSNVQFDPDQNRNVLELQWSPATDKFQLLCLYKGDLLLETKCFVNNRS
ncbi:hypothetical protein EVAR_10716_1 [Eumeta japonica]|uniref:Uncharacterized protein n=1 Tax=Eumeta variegata TaxID=151549 RepID=A0A4C1U8K1_EUMVA|nr:hypothetical protein EVAR_10716_1 [Eumeta japonica]